MSDLDERLAGASSLAEFEAEARAWRVVGAAFAEREPAPVRRRRPARRVLLPAVAAALVALALAAAATPAGRSVIDGVRHVVGAKDAAPTLVSLPAEGPLLVVARQDGGVWIVHPDGSKRRLGNYDDASWSPRGLFVVATRRNELRALEPDGDVRWTLSRPGIGTARWSPSGFRIAYTARTGLRVVAGDGTGDRLLERWGGGPLAWRPAQQHELTSISAGDVVHRDVDSSTVLWRASLRGADAIPRSLAWSDDGKLLAVALPHELLLLDAEGRTVRRVRFESWQLVEAQFRPGTHAVLLHLRADAPERRSEVRLLTGGQQRTLFAGPGVLGGIAPAQDGRWLLLDWTDADQWLFVDLRRIALPRPARVRAVADVAEQFDQTPPAILARPTLLVSGRWCCGGEP